MRIHKLKWNNVGRRIIALLLLCGLLLPCLPSASADTVTYEYTRINSISGLPTDNQWHDYFIAWERRDVWEDTHFPNQVYFTDYHYYTTSGDSNIDEGGSHFMQYRASSRLQDPTATSFTSERKLGHMQFKYAGMDPENNAPMYYIRVSKMNGGYMYFTQYEPTSKEDDADAFTFEDHGEDFHIYVNIAGKADRYLTMDGNHLETTESSSWGGGEKYRNLRIYKQSYIVDENANDDSVIGKVTLYEYTWVNTVEEMLALAENSKDWTDIMLAWEDADGSDTSNPDKVWFAKETWYDDNNKPNYDNDWISWQYYSNDVLGSDGYSSPYADTFILPYKASHTQIKFWDWDSQNPVEGYTNASGNKQDSPKFFMRHHVIQDKYIYPGTQSIDEYDSRTPWTTQLRLGKTSKDDRDGTVHIFYNMADGGDTYFTRVGNRIDNSSYTWSKMWEFSFRIYACRTVEYDAIVKSFTIGKGATYAVDSQLIVKEGVTITVEDGGVLAIDKSLLNNGKIVVKNGGTVIVNDGGYLMAYDKHADGTISLDGGNLLIMDGAKVICDQNGGTLTMDNASTILNRGLLLIGEKLVMNRNSCLKNESMGLVIYGGYISRERGGVGSLSFDEVTARVHQVLCKKLVSGNSKIINNGKTVELKAVDPGNATIPNTTVGIEGKPNRVT